MVIYAGGQVCIFYGQTLSMGIKYLDVLFTGTTLKLIFFYHTSKGILSLLRN